MSLRRSIPILACALAVACGDDSDAVDSEGSTGAAETGFESSGTDAILTGGLPGTDTGLEPTGDADSVGPATCDPQNDDCGDGFKCGGNFDFTGDPAYECVPVIGDAGPGELCDLDPTGMMSDTCDAGSFCLSDTMSSSGVCAAYCDGDDRCADPDQNCVSVYGLALPLCMSDCDPLDVQGCPDGWTCREDASARSWYCAPTLAGAAGGHGGSCVPQALGLCDPGFSCRTGPVVDADGCDDPTEGSGCCAQLCNVTDDIDCPGELEECLPYYPDGAVPPESSNLGVCAVPVGE